MWYYCKLIGGFNKCFFYFTENCSSIAHTHQQPYSVHFFRTEPFSGIAMTMVVLPSYPRDGGVAKHIASSECAPHVAIGCRSQSAVLVWNQIKRTYIFNTSWNSTHLQVNFSTAPFEAQLNFNSWMRVEIHLKLDWFTREIFNCS